jgi:hypothetical protein
MVSLRTIRPYLKAESSGPNRAAMPFTKSGANRVVWSMITSPRAARSLSTLDQIPYKLIRKAARRRSAGLVVSALSALADSAFARLATIDVLHVMDDHFA